MKQFLKKCVLALLATSGSVNGQVLFRTTTVDGGKNRFQLIPGGSSDAANLYLYYGNIGDGTLSVRINAQGDSYLNGGNVGIGTTLPKTSLDIVKDSDIWHLMVGGSTKKLLVGGQAVSGDVVLQAGAASTVNNAAVTTPYNLCLQRDGGNVGIGTPSPGTGNSEGAIVRFRGKNAEKAVIGTVDSWFSSNVGIGTTSPIGRLNVSKDSTTDGLSQAITVNSSSVITKRMNLGYVPGSNYAFIDVINYGISNTSQALSLQPNGGNVGIGTTTPLAKLDIQGTQGQLFSVTDDLSGSIFAVSDISGVPIFDVNSSGVSYFDGKVGIGVTSPTAKLQVAGTTTYNSDTIQALRVCDATDVSKGIHIGFDVVQNAGVIQAGDFGVSYRNLSLNPNVGNVGIGTTTPTAPLHIEGGTNSEVLKIEADSNPFIRWVENGTDVGFLQFLGDNAYLSNMSNGSLFIRTNNTDKMTITSAGNVGIGTTSPGNKLSIAEEMGTTFSNAFLG